MYRTTATKAYKRNVKVVIIEISTNLICIYIKIEIIQYQYFIEIIMVIIDLSAFDLEYSRLWAACMVLFF